MEFGRRANQSNIVAVFISQQRTQAAVFDVAVQRASERGGHSPRVPAEAEDIASFVNGAPTAVCVAVGGQLAPSQFALSVQLLLRGEERRRHERNRVAEDSA